MENQNQNSRYAANREVGRAVSHAVRAVEGDISRETQKLVRNAVQQSYGKLQKAVTDAIAKEAAKVDQSAIVGKIYQSIASSMADKAGKDVTLKLG